MLTLDFSFVISFLNSTFGVSVCLHFCFGISVLGFSFCMFFINWAREHFFDQVSLGQTVGFEANRTISNFAQEFYCEERREIKVNFTVHFTG